MFNFCKLGDIMVNNVDDSLDDNSPSFKKPFDAYEGDKPYIFISYAHKDRELVFPEIKKFHDEGYPIWYDDGITPGQEWDDEIGTFLMNCSLLVIFISENSMNSTNVKDEIKLALDKNINVVPIYLEKTELPPGLELRLSNKHAIFKYLATEEDYIKDCFKAFEKYGISILKKPCPFPPYEGNKNYIFVNYSHKDSDRVCKEIKKFKDDGYHVWYSDEINPGENWEEDIVKHLHGASLFIVFMTSDSVNLNGIKNRIFYALNMKIPILLIYLDDYDKTYDLMDIKLKHSLNNIPEIKRLSLSDEEYVQKYTEEFKKWDLSTE